MKIHEHDRRHVASWAWGIVRGKNELLIFLGKKHIHIGRKR
jgi:hypothetical protein